MPQFPWFIHAAGVSDNLNFFDDIFDIIVDPNGLIGWVQSALQARVMCRNSGWAGIFVAF